MEHRSVCIIAVQDGNPILKTRTPSGTTEGNDPMEAKAGETVMWIAHPNWASAPIEIVPPTWFSPVQEFKVRQGGDTYRIFVSTSSPYGPDDPSDKQSLDYKVLVNGSPVEHPITPPTIIMPP